MEDPIKSFLNILERMSNVYRDREADGHNEHVMQMLRVSKKLIGDLSQSMLRIRHKPGVDPMAEVQKALGQLVAELDKNYPPIR